MGLTGGVTPELTEGMPHIQDPYSKLVAFQEEMSRLTQAVESSLCSELTAKPSPA